MDDRIRARLEGLTENIQEALASTAAVKGDRFADAVCTHFEASQLMEILGMLASLIPEEKAEHAASLCRSAATIATSMAMRICDDLSDEDFKESMALSEQLIKRKDRTSEEIERDLKNDSED